MFDFDGTVGLVRAGWMRIMLDMMMETLAPLGDPAALREEALGYVARLTGRDTLLQMEAFASHAASLGADTLPASAYKAEFVRRIDVLRRRRLRAVADGSAPRETLLVPGVLTLLDSLRAEGVALYLASGTAHDLLLHDVGVLELDACFDGVHGSAPDQPTKRGLLERLIAGGIPPEQIVTFGDGISEIADASETGGIAVGVATDEPHCLQVDPEKREWLISAGADYIVPHYLAPGIMDIVRGLI